MSRRGRRKKGSLDPTLSRGIIAVIVIMFAIIITLSFFDNAGWVGTMINEYLLAFLFGNIRYAVPAIMVILAAFLIRDSKNYYRATHKLGALLFFLSLSSILHITFPVDDMWMQAIEGNGGGVFGMLAWPLKTYLGAIASYVILGFTALISVFLIFNTSFAAFVMIHEKLFQGLGAIGRGILWLIKKLFVPRMKAHSEDTDADYDAYDDDGDEDGQEEDDEPDQRRRGLFHRRRMAHNEEEDDEEHDDMETEDDGEDYEETDVSVPQKNIEKASDVWSKRVIVKNLPPVNILSSKRSKPTSGDIKSNAKTIQDTLREFHIDVDMGEIQIGPTVTQYSLKPAKGVKLTKITSLSNDLSLALAAHPIRIEAPIPGKALVGIEVPNEKTAMVTFKELLESKEFQTRKHNMMIALGKDVAGKVWFADLPRMPHLLVAGATGSGKTVCMNTIIMSLLFQNTAETLRFIMVDPKRVELTLYNGIPHLLTPVITNTQKTVNALKWTIGEMDRRFELLASVGSRDITSYNQKHPKTPIPHIVFVIDELADLMATAASEVESGIIRLAQMARAVGIHLVLATQRPSVDVITGLMKANIPGRIAFSVASLTDSRTILDAQGAEKLLGRGDMLLSTAELSKPVRIQGAFISEDEMKEVVGYLQGDEDPEYDDSIVETQKGGTASMFGGPSDDQDPLFAEAQEAVIKAKKASASLLQRRLKIGYARAARILDELEDAGIIGPAQGAKPREILVTEAKIPRPQAGGEHNVFKAPEPDDEEDAEYEEIEDEDTEEDDDVDEQDAENYDEESEEDDADQDDSDGDSDGEDEDDDAKGNRYSY